MTISRPRSKSSVLVGRPYPLLLIVRQTEERSKQRKNIGKNSLSLHPPKRKQRKLHYRWAQPTFLPFVTQSYPVYLLRSYPSRADAPYPGASKVSQHCLCGLLLPHPLARGGSWVFQPVCLPYVLPQLLDLRQPGPALREKVVAGLLFSSPAPPKFVIHGLVNPVLQVRADRRVTGQELVIPTGD